MKASIEGQGALSAPRHHHNPNPFPNGREDCWSEGATSVLIDAWGDRYLHLNRGNLRQNDWKDVSDAVNSRHNGIKPRKTDVQCKNRIDTLKKKYKIEKAKPSPSQWPFFSRIDFLIGPSSASVKPAGKTPAFPSFKQLVYSGGSSSKSRPNSAESSRGGGNNHNNDDEDEDDVGYEGGSGGRKQRRTSGDSGDGALRELAQAIVKFGEVYERIENSKQRQMMELERQRMEFTKELEFQRMQMFMEAQLELEKMKRPKLNSGTSALNGARW